MSVDTRPQLLPPSGPPPRQRRRFSLAALLGEILITLGVIVLLFVVWQLWWTDVTSRASFEATGDALQSEWHASAGDAPKQISEPDYGEAFALMYIPAIKDAVWGVPVVEGTSRDELMRGVGHHPDAALPGEDGNFAVAGHRVTYGKPFNQIAELRPGDQVIVETESGYYTYELDNSEIVEASEGWVLQPNPQAEITSKPGDPLITIYSCHPMYSAAQRYVYFGHLVEETTKDNPPAALEDSSA